MPAFPIRAHTHQILPASWTGSKAHDPSLTYRQYNAGSFEPWLEKVYSPNAKPFIDASSSVFAKYTGDYATSIRRNVARVIRMCVVDQLGVFYKYGAIPEITKVWHDYTVAEREEKLLTAWQQQQERSESANLCFGRVEAPEMTLEWARDPWNLDVLLTAIMFEEQDEGVEYKHVPNERWERMCDATASPTPPS